MNLVVYGAAIDTFSARNIDRVAPSNPPIAPRIVYLGVAQIREPFGYW